MESFQVKSIEETPPTKIQKKLVLMELFLRIIGIIATLISIGIMVTSNETILYLDIEFQAKYSYSSAFKYFVAANAFSFVFSLVSLFLMKRKQSQDRMKYFIIFIIDLISTAFELTGCAAATSIGYVGLYGDIHTGWMGICDQFGKFCHRTMVSILVAFMASFLFLFLTISSSWKSMKLAQSQPSPMY